MPVEISASYAEQARAAGDQADLHVLEGVGHFELIDPLSQAWPAVLDAIGTALS
jgi:acetyl esterase/lipase